MNFKIESLPEDSDTILAALRNDLLVAVSDFEAKAAAILVDYNQRPAQRASALDFVRRDALIELDEIGRMLRRELRDFAKHTRDLRRVLPASGDSLLRYIEARTVLRTTTSAKRQTLLQGAIGKKDRLILQAVIDGPGLLSGLTAEEHSVFAERAYDTLHGAESRELEQAESLANELVKNVETARIYINSFGKENLAHVA